MNERESLLALALSLVFPTIFQFSSAIRHFYSIGKSKSAKKKNSKTIPLWKKTLLIGYVEKTRYHCLKARLFCYAYWGYLLSLLICILLWVIAVVFPEMTGILKYCVYAKILLFDISVNIYGVLMTKHAISGGRTWVW